jgi:hypothetical protein
MTREEAEAALVHLAAQVREADPELAAGRLLERVAEDGPELRDALLELGARAVIRGVRP